jgi:hypothetical protein
MHQIVSEFQLEISSYFNWTLINGSIPNYSKDLTLMSIMDYDPYFEIR